MTDNLIEQQNQGSQGIIDKMLTIFEPVHKEHYILEHI